MRYLKTSLNRSKWTKFRVILAIVGLSVLASSDGWAEEWVLYAGSSPVEDEQSGLIDWYASNKLKPASETRATVHHYYDRESVASNSPVGGVIFRVWEKSVTQGEIRTYDETIEEIEKEEEKKLKRRTTILDMARVFPIAVKRAAKEIATLYEINCENGEFYVLEVNTYDKTGQRMTRKLNMDTASWATVHPGTVMELLSKEVCK